MREHRWGVQISQFWCLQASSIFRESSVAQIWRKFYGKRRSIKNLDGLYQVLAPCLNIIKVSPTTSTKKEPGKPILTVLISDIASLGTLQKRQTPLKVYADQRGLCTCEKLLDVQIQSHVKQFTRKLKGDKNIKHRRREPGIGVSFSQSIIPCGMRGRIPKILNFPAI